MNDNVHPLLRSNASDHAASALRALSGLVDKTAPGFGSVFSELVCFVIPNLKSERLEEYLTRLGRRLHAIEAKVDGLAGRLGPEQIALFEDGARSAVMATSNNRIEQIAGIVAHGMVENDRKASAGRSFLMLLNQLTDADVIVLSSYHQKYLGDEKWMKLHKEILHPSNSKFDSRENGEPIWNAAAYAASAEERIQTQRLLSLGLIRW